MSQKLYVVLRDVMTQALLTVLLSEYILDNVKKIYPCLLHTRKNICLFLWQVSLYFICYFQERLPSLQKLFHDGISYKHDHEYRNICVDYILLVPYNLGVGILHWLYLIRYGTYRVQISTI